MTQEDFDSTASESSDYSFEQSLENRIELKEGDSYTSHDAFVIAVKTYAKQQGFKVRLGKYEKNAAGEIRKRTIVCSREGTSGSKRSIPLEVQQKIMLLRRAGCNIPTICAILKEEFDGIITWMYNDLYNFIYQQEETEEKRELDANNFTFYKCLDEYEEDNFMKKWEQLKADYPKAVKYLLKMDKNLKQSMNNLMKGYMDAMTSLTVFLKAFESALEQRQEAAEFIKYQENNEIINLVTSSPYEKQ
ncbi:3704_t:CDS:2 [Racocetra fulgida]|uniref:3704_t:CDS:1 n=1 Tax=Racocetra fulgida TaxID=60492 RepID=A0A9N9H108_9GLOM|nr:3704_t:CDS:2 [Racocetra fulgida]